MEIDQNLEGKESDILFDYELFSRSVLGAYERRIEGIVSSVSTQLLNETER